MNFMPPRASIGERLATGASLLSAGVSLYCSVQILREQRDDARAVDRKIRQNWLIHYPRDEKK